MVDISIQPKHYAIFIQLEKKGIIRGYQTLIDVSKLGYDNYRLFLKFHKDTPDEEKEIIEYFKKHPRQMYNMAPRAFEELIAAIFRNQGFETTLTPESKDGGFDIIAIKHDLYTGRNTYLIE